MTPSRHDDMVPLLGPAALGLLTSREQEQLDRHVAGCAACREELASLTGVADRLGDLDAESALAAPPTGVADAVLERVARERRRAQRRPGPAAAAASVAVSGDGTVEASAALVAHTWGVEIKLAAAGLAAGAPYTVQVTTQQGQVVDAGAFLGTGARTLNCNLNASVLREDARSFAVLDGRGEQVLTARL
jgi:anti-sigma factor RsiW